MVDLTKHNEESNDLDQFTTERLEQMNREYQMEKENGGKERKALPEGAEQSDGETEKKSEKETSRGRRKVRANASEENAQKVSVTDGGEGSEDGRQIHLRMPLEVYRKLLMFRIVTGKGTLNGAIVDVLSDGLDNWYAKAKGNIEEMLKWK